MLRQRHSTVYAIKNFLDRGNFTLFGTVNEFACNDAKAFSQFAIRLPRLPVQFEKQRVAHELVRFSTPRRVLPRRQV